MEPARPTSWWRGYVNQVTYGLDLHQRVSDEDVAWLADDMIAQRTFTHPVATYYEATAAALQPGELSGGTGGEDTEQVERDFLTRFKQALDERRPWPEPPFSKGDLGDWDSLRAAPVIGRLALPQLDVETRLNRSFIGFPHDAGEVRALILRLRTGEHIALIAPPAVTERGIEVRAHTNPESTRTAVRELTGLEVIGH